VVEVDGLEVKLFQQPEEPGHAFWILCHRGLLTRRSWPRNRPARNPSVTLDGHTVAAPRDASLAAMRQDRICVCVEWAGARDD
jgi:hypothetical protein